VYKKRSICWFRLSIMPDCFMSIIGIRTESVMIRYDSGFYQKLRYDSAESTKNLGMTPLIPSEQSHI